MSAAGGRAGFAMLGILVCATGCAPDDEELGAERALAPRGFPPQVWLVRADGGFEGRIAMPPGHAALQLEASGGLLERQEGTGSSREIRFRIRGQGPGELRVVLRTEAGGTRSWAWPF